MGLETKFKYYQLVYHEIPFSHYCIHEALAVAGQRVPYWVGSKPVRKYDSYHDAMDAWANMEPVSCDFDILEADDIKDLMDRVDYSDNETELDFD